MEEQELLEHLIIRWRNNAEQAEKNFDGTKLEILKHRFRSQEQTYNECADELTGLLQSIDQFKKLNNNTK